MSIRPVTLKLEKVYMGSLLVSKKRYVGNKFESPTQESGVIDSKGIETVRRDSCGVVQHAMQVSLETLFASCDLTLVKERLEKYWQQILENRVPLKDFIFAKEVRLGTYSNGRYETVSMVTILVEWWADVCTVRPLQRLSVPWLWKRTLEQSHGTRSGCPMLWSMGPLVRDSWTWSCHLMSTSTSEDASASTTTIISTNRYKAALLLLLLFVFQRL